MFKNIWMNLEYDHHIALSSKLKSTTLLGPITIFMLCWQIVDGVDDFKLLSVRAGLTYK